VNVQQLDDKSDEAKRFLETRLGESLTLKDGVMDVEGPSKSRLRVYLKRFLHVNRLNDKFRVLVSESEIRISPVKTAE
jgi:hypothetical protein